MDLLWTLDWEQKHNKRLANCTRPKCEGVLQHKRFPSGCFYFLKSVVPDKLAPKHAAGKVPVPWAESVTGRPGDLDLAPSAKLRWSCGFGFWSFAAAKTCCEHLQKCQLNGAHSLHAPFVRAHWGSVKQSQTSTCDFAYSCGRYLQTAVDAGDHLSGVV